MIRDNDLATIAVPPDLAGHAEHILGTDPRFNWLLEPNHTLASALMAGAVASAVAEDAIEQARGIIALGTIEKQMRYLIKCAYIDAFGKEAKPACLNALGARFGVTGKPVTLQEAGAIANVTRERLRQITARVVPLLRGAWMPAVEEAARVLVEASPVAPPIGDLLSQHKLSGPQMTADGFFKIVELIGLDLKQVTGTALLTDDGWVVDERNMSVTGAIRVAAKHTSTYGMTNVEEIRQELSTSGNSADADDIMRVLKADPNVRWADNWLWVEKEHDRPHANSLINTMRNMLSVNAPLTAQSLFEGVARKNKFRGREIVPPPDAILAFAEASPHFTMDRDLISPVTPLDYHEVLGAVAASVVDVIKASPYGVMDRASFNQACEDVGISRNTLNVWTSYAEWLERVARNVWGPRGVRVSPAVVAEIQNAARVRAAAEPHRTDWEWTPDGRIALTMDVDTSTYYSAVWTFEDSLRKTIGARRFTAWAADQDAGTITIGSEHNWVWGWAPAMRLMGVRAGDVLRAVLDLQLGTVEITKGGRELWNL